VTSEEEARFRVAARKALAMGGDIAMAFVGKIKRSDLPEAFEVVKVDTEVVALFIPEAWEHEPDAEDRCQAILREEQKALTGQALD
jgi:hypothetical protein